MDLIRDRCEQDDYLNTLCSEASRGNDKEEKEKESLIINTEKEVD